MGERIIVIDIETCSSVFRQSLREIGEYIRVCRDSGFTFDMDRAAELHTGDIVVDDTIVELKTAGGYFDIPYLDDLLKAQEERLSRQYAREKEPDEVQPEYHITKLQRTHPKSWRKHQ